MRQFLVAIQLPDNYDPSLEDEAVIRDVQWMRRLHGHVRPPLPVGCRSRCEGSSSAHGLIARLRKGDSQ